MHYLLRVKVRQTSRQPFHRNLRVEAGLAVLLSQTTSAMKLFLDLDPLAVVVHKGAFVDRIDVLMGKRTEPLEVPLKLLGCTVCSFEPTH